MAAKKPLAQPRGTLSSTEIPDYGMCVGEFQTRLKQELFFFRRKEGSQDIIKTHIGLRNRNLKGKPRWYHAKQVIDILWNYEGSRKPFEWHPDAMRMLKAACKHRRLGVPGAGSTGKSDFFAVWAIIIWLSNPCKGTYISVNGEILEGAMVIVTSTTKSAAANRIWGKIVAYWNGLIGQPPGKLMSSEYLICYWNPTTGDTDRTVGIKLVAGEASKAAESADEIRGIKGDPVVLIIDEMEEVGHSLLNTFDENLSANYNNQVIGLANPASYFSPFGELCEPENGWESVGDDDYEWVAKKGGYVLRLDAEQSPNVLEGRVIYSFLMQADQLEERVRVLGGRHTPKYYRGVRGMWHREGDEEAIYSQAELLAGNACKAAVWRGQKTAVGGFDPSFTTGGDRSVLSIGYIGITTDNKLTLEYFKHIELHADTRDKDTPHMVQIARKLVALCKEYGIEPLNLAVDASGPGGKAFRDILITEWTKDFLCVDFSGSPSEKPVSNLDSTPCNKRYDRRVSEIWFTGKSLLRTDQLRGITKELANELVIRKYKETRPGSKDSRIIVETKKEMKNRTQRSPDIGDSFMVLCELARTRHALVSRERPADRKQGAKDPLRDRFRKLQNIYAGAA